MRGFKIWLNENFGDDVEPFKGIQPYHQYKTEDGHAIDVHLLNNPKGRHAVFYNKNLGTITKLVHWNHGVKDPSKQELEQSGREKEYMQEAAKKPAHHSDLDPDSAGKIAEHATMIYLHGHRHEQAGTYKSKQHLADIKPHEEEIKKLSAGKDEEAVKIRKEHGRSNANAIVEQIKQAHGPQAQIINVGHTSKPGDIAKFTRGKHEDSQENPSDVAVEIAHSHSIPEESKETLFEGSSLKSSKKSNKITAKNPAIHMNGDLDHPTRTFNAEKISREGIKGAVKKMGFEGKTAAQRQRIIKDVRAKEGVKNLSSIELEANKHGKKIKSDLADELHAHLSHLTTLGDEGHQIIGKMLGKHLTAETSMPWSKVHTQGEKVDRIKTTITHGSESPMRKIFANKKTRYAVSRSTGGDRVSIHKVEKDGSLTPLAHYSPKTKSNMFGADVHGWNVLPGNVH